MNKKKSERRVEKRPESRAQNPEPRAQNPLAQLGDGNEEIYDPGRWQSRRCILPATWANKSEIRNQS